MTRTVETLVSDARLQATGPHGSCEIADVLVTVVGASRESARLHGQQHRAGSGAARSAASGPAPTSSSASSIRSSRTPAATARRACTIGVVRTGASRVQVRVADDGVGIADDERERIFDAGFRGRASTANANERGAGLGLALARRLALSAGATIDAPPSDAGGLIVVDLPAT